MDALELDAIGQADAIRSGHISSEELCRAASERLSDSDAALNSVVWLRGEDDIRPAVAAAPSGRPFSGVPIVLKDLPGWQAGVPMGLGVRALEQGGVTAPADSPGGARLRSAGFVTLATTSTSPYGWGPWAATERGHTRTPYDLGRASNGSSGGSAASVAVGAVAVGTGADASGSIRLPAAWCGVIGHKPSRGLVPSAWAHPQVAEGVCTRSVRDTAAVLDVLSQPEPGSMFSAPIPPGGFLGALEQPLVPLRIAVLDEFTEDTTSATKGVVAEMGRRLAELGHYVEQATPAGIYAENADHSAGLALHALVSQALVDAAEWLGRPLREDETEPYVAMMAGAGDSASARDELRRLRAMQDWARSLCSFWRHYDILITPTTPFTALKISEWQPNPEDPMEPWSRWGPVLDYTEPFNRSGQPAVSVPAAVVDGLPHGIQLVGRHGEDALVLQLGAQLEAAGALQGTSPLWPLDTRPSS